MRRSHRSTRWAVQALSLSVSAIAVTQAGGQLTTWIGPATGSWTVASNWNNGVPNSGSAVAFVDGGGAANCDDVQINTSVTLNQLQISSGDQVNMLNGAFVNWAGNGTLNLATGGTFNMNATTSGGFSISGNLSITGGGVLNLNAGSQSSAYVAGGTLTNAASIRGAGYLGYNSVVITNSGLIAATSGQLALTIDPANLGASPGAINTGTFRADGGVLNLTGNGAGWFDNTGGRIIAGTSDVQLLSGVAISGGTIASSGAGVVRVVQGHSASLYGVINTGVLSLDNASSTNLYSSMLNAGTLNVAPTDNNTVAYINGSFNLSGGGVFRLGQPGSAGAAILAGSGTLVTDNHVRGAGYFGNNSIAIINNALVRADAGGLTVDPANLGATVGFLNNGSLLADGGALTLTGNGGGFFVNGPSGRIIAGDSDVRLVGGVDLREGLYSSSGAGVFRVIEGHSSQMTNATLAGHLVLDNAAYLALHSTATNNGSISINPAASSTTVFFNGPFTLAGAGTIYMNDSAAGGAALVTGSGTLVSDNLIRGAGFLANNSLIVVNSAAIVADNPARALTIDPANNGANPGFVNRGTLTADGGLLVLTGNGNGFFDNAAGHIAATSGDVQIDGSVDVRGGTLGSSTGNRFYVPAGHNAYLHGITSTANITHLGGNGNLFLYGTIMNNGSINLSPGTTDYANLNPGGGSLNLAGGGVINLDYQPGGGTAYISGGGTVVFNQNVRGGGNLGANNTALINNATILADLPNRSLDIDPANAGAVPGFINNGTLRAAGGEMIFTGNGTGFIGGAGSIDIAANGTFTATAAASGWQGPVINAGVLNVTNSSDVTVQRFRGPGTVNVSQYATLRLAAGGGTVGTSSTAALNVTNYGRLDLANHDLAIDYAAASPIAALRPLLQTGFNNGAWNGVGIASSTAGGGATDKTGIGYAEASQIYGAFPADFSGVAVDGTTVLLRYTLMGDANLDRTVNIADFARLAASYNAAGLWIDGDFNYDGTIAIGDFSLLAANFNRALSADLSDRGAAVPEPAAALASAGCLAALLLARRRSA